VFRLGFLFLLLASLAHADFGEVWVRKHAFAAGLDFAASKGDFNGKDTIPIKSELVLQPKISSFLIYAFDARAFLNEHAIAFNFGLGFPGEARYFRLGLEYQYYFLWPEPFRIGTGLGYAFSSMRFSEASFEKENEKSYANFTGNGGHAVLSAQYYFTENFAVESAIRCRFLYLNKVATPVNDISRLNPAVWQKVGELGLRGMFVF